MDKQINYRQRWLEQMPESRNSYVKPEAAQAYDRSRKIWQDGEHRVLTRILCEPQDTVLDIGSGPGILAIPLARRVRQVTVIDASKAMLDLLRTHLQDADLSNIQIIEGRWEELDYEKLGRFDTVIASYSLSMRDMGAALAAMDAVAKKRVYLYWFCGMTSWEKLCHDLYPQVHGQPFVPYPKTDLLYGMLAEMGISAHVSDLTGTAFDHVYPSLEAAVDNLRRRLRLEPDDTRHEPLLKQYIRQHYRPEPDGWRFVDQSHYVEIMWEKNHEESVD